MLEYRSESEDENSSYVADSNASKLQPTTTNADKTKATFDKELPDASKDPKPTVVKNNIRKTSIPNTHSRIDLNKSAREEDDSESNKNQFGPQSHASPIPTSPSFNSPSQQNLLINNSPNRKEEEYTKTNKKNHGDNRSNRIPMKPRYEKRKTRMEIGEVSKEGNNKREAIKTLNFSPRVTRSKSKWKVIQESDKKKSKQGQEDETGSCSMNVAEQSYAYSIGRSIGFENRGGCDGLGDAESTMGDKTSKSGGLISVWNKNLFQKLQCILRQDSIIVKGTWIESGADICFINIYASQNRDKRKELWSFITAVLSSWNGLVVIFGDFNEVRDEKERRGTSFDRIGAIELERFINTNELEDLKIGGKNFTWYNKKCTKMSRLDRILISKEVGNIWENIEVITYNRRFSDHSPLILKQISKNFGPIPFKFYNSWLMDKDFGEKIKQIWENFDLRGEHLKLHYLMKKLKFAKTEIIKWQKNKRESSEVNKKVYLKTIEEIDKRIEVGINSDQDIIEREIALDSLWKMEKQEHEDNKQKYKNKWCLEGDENSKLFHRNLNKKKRKGGIKGIMKEGTWYTDPNTVKLTFFEHFQDRFKRNQEDSWSQNLTNLKQLSEDQKTSLEKPFTEEEIKAAIWDCGREKSPGPDGFNIEFIKSCWEMVKQDITEAIQEFQNNSVIPRGCNSAFISLIPKKLDASEVHDFRPISLVGIVFKILSKTLAIRLKKILHFVINPIQSAFVQDRQIMDGPMIINEIIDWAKKKKQKVFMFKTDIAKAYDSVSWKYLDEVMEAMNFGLKWRS